MFVFCSAEYERVGSYFVKSLHEQSQLVHENNV